jgi:hypothetical protein
MNLFLHIPLMGVTLLTLISVNNSPKNFSDFEALSEVCDVEYSKVTAIATCKIDNLDMSFEEKVKFCTLKMRIVNHVPTFN